jgi:hypothetical protein
MLKIKSRKEWMFINNFESLGKWFVIGTKFLLKTTFITTLMHVFHCRDCCRLGVAFIKRCFESQISFSFLESTG